LDPATDPLKQRHSKLAFEFAHGDAHRRLCHVQLLRGPAEA
jgi:hypothetical protein